MKIKISNANTPSWKNVAVKARIPVELEKLDELANNIWWAWNYQALELFRGLDQDIWKSSGHNPVLMMERLSYEKLEKIAKDENIIKDINKVYDMFREYMDVKPDSTRPSVAYFCMEYGMTNILKKVINLMNCLSD